MSRWFHQSLAAVLCASFCLPATALPAAAAGAETDARIVHVLNRLGYGPRPGDVEAVARIGLEQWISQQLHPERIPDTALAGHLAGLRTLGLSTAQILAGYDPPREARRELAKRKAEAASNPSEQDERRARREVFQNYAGQMQGRPRQVVDEAQAAKVLRAVYSERQLDEVLVDFWLNHFNVYANKGPLRFMLGEYERDVIRPHAWGRFEDLLRATARSPAMLFYLDNWLSVDEDAAAQRPHRRQAMGGRGFGRGRSRGGFGFGSGPELRMQGERQPQAKDKGKSRRNGLNENYAREIMELHTLGVDGGYTQKDVTEVARCLTGWTIEGLRQQNPRFAFDRRVHDRGDKRVLGTEIRGGGIEEGEQVIHLLATHPATAHFIASKLVRRFVADEPPPALVERAAATFLRTQGDIRAVVTTIVSAPEFLAPATRAAKVKTPLEFVTSAVRASGAAVSDASELARKIGEMGMPLYQQQPPTGYKDTADAWVSTSGLLARLNFALDLAAGKLRGVEVDPARLEGDLTARWLPGGLSDTTRQALAKEGANGSPVRLAGLVLGSPEFQRR